MDKEAGEMMIKVCGNLIKMLELSFQGFRKGTEESLKEVENAKNEVQKKSSELAHFLILKSSPYEKGKEWAKPYVSMATSLDRICFNIEAMTDRLKTKVQNQISFSDQAVKEINFIFQEARDLLKRLSELILNPTKSLAQSIGEHVRSVLKIVNGYSEGHEDRLIQEICTPRSSPIYLGILESLKGVIAHILEISGKIVSVSHPSNS